MEENKSKVYVQVDSNDVVININSSIFITELKEWIEIDEGQGDKYAHAQESYLENKLRAINGKFNYKLVDGKIVQLTEEEKEKLFQMPNPQPTQEELMNNIILDNLNMQAQLDALITSGLGGN